MIFFASVEMHSQCIVDKPDVEFRRKSEESNFTNTQIGPTSMRITSSAFKNGEKIPQKYTCEGFNWNPPLQFFDVPKQAKSLVLIVDDPDVPHDIRPDGTWIHWIVYDIPANTPMIKEHSAPPGTAGKGTNGRTAYMGPCPPDREHRYFFKLYALDAIFDLPKGLTIEEVLQKIEPHIIEKAELMGRYELQKKRMS